MNGEVKRRRSVLVPLPRVRAAIKQRPHGSRRSRSHRPVQGGDAAAIDGIGIGTNRHKVLDHVSLGRRIPSIGVRRVMKGFRASAILRSTIGSARNQAFRKRTPKRRGRDMQRSIAGIHVVNDFGEKKGCGLLTCCSHA